RALISTLFPYTTLFRSYPMFHTDSQDGSGNRWNYSNPELDEVLEAGRQESDEDAREEYYVEAQDILVNDLPITPLYYGELGPGVDRKSTRLNSSHVSIS